MMWACALGVVHLLVVATPKALVFDSAIILLALAGAAMQDRQEGKAVGRPLA
jgi:hypothetical protein